MEDDWGSEFEQKYVMRSTFWRLLGQAGKLLAEAYRQADVENQVEIKSLAFTAMTDALVEYEGFKPADVAEVVERVA